MYKLKTIFIFLLLATNIANAQELNARVTINSSSIASSVNKNVFQTLQTAITTFINTRSWTSASYLPNEKIDCSFLFNLQPTSDLTVFTASLTIQAARPVFNSSYVSPIMNFQDKDVSFKYIEFQQLDFNDNRVSGTDALSSNLTAVIAYYAYMILGFDGDSFSPRGGDIYFQKAQNVVNNAPEDGGISGWKAFDGIRNRYWLVENMTNSRYTSMHDVYYNYYRKGLDQLYDNENAGRTEILNVLSLLNSFTTDNPSVMISQFFFQGKSTELIKIFSKAAPQDKARASELLQKMDVTNSARYKDELN
ncbi:MAG TPA: DUF4835 family protein [Ferruginibacter sp.]|jgi:hypothetical protein|nr:DUF4835 family protein [Ferruginibacter sp.]